MRLKPTSGKSTFFGQYTYVKRHIKFLHKEGIPIVEVVHNMYVYYCDHVAEIERENEKYYTKLIAVSEIVKET